MEIFVKNIKLINNSKAIVKSKWCNDDITLNIFVNNEGSCNIYTGQCTAEDILAQCNPLDIEYEKMKNYLTCETKTDGIMYDITGSKFIVFVKEYLGTDSEGYADIIYFKLPLKCEMIPTSIIFEQISEMASTIIRNNERANKDKETIKKLTEWNETLLGAQKEFEMQFYDRAAALFNAKKKFIQENVANIVSNLNISHNVKTSEELMTKNKKLEEKLYSSPSRSPTKRASSTKINTTPKRTPIKGAQRTPSRTLLKIQDDFSDSDDSFAVLSSSTKMKTLQKSASESLDSSRVFKNFKIKTPVKQKDDKRESSVELKIEKNTNNDNSESEQKSLESKASKGSANQQNAQQMEVDDNDIKSKTLFAFDDSQPLFSDDEPSQPAMNDTIIDNDEEIPCSQDSQEMVTSYTERLRLKAQNKAKKRKTENSTSINPYDVDTVNILNMSD